MQMSYSKTHSLLLYSLQAEIQKWKKKHGDQGLKKPHLMISDSDNWLLSVQKSKQAIGTKMV